MHLLHVTTPLSVCPGTPATPATPANIVQGLPDWASQITNTDTVAAVAQILQSPQGQQVSFHPASLKLLNKKCLVIVNNNPQESFCLIKQYFCLSRACSVVCVAVLLLVLEMCQILCYTICCSCSSWYRVYSCNSRSPSHPCCRPWMLAWSCSCKL